MALDIARFLDIRTSDPHHPQPLPMEQVSDHPSSFLTLAGFLSLGRSQGTTQRCLFPFRYVLSLLFDCSHRNSAVVIDLMLSNLFWRHTKESARDSFQLPEIYEEHLLLEFTDIERGLYEIEQDNPGTCCVT